MKKILKSKRKYSYLDFLKLFILFFWHIFVWSLFTALLYLAQYLKTRIDFIAIYENKQVITIYLVIASPIISYVSHSFFLEGGYLTTKAVLWIHSMAIIIAAFISFIFF